MLDGALSRHLIALDLILILCPQAGPSVLVILPFRPERSQVLVLRCDLGLLVGLVLGMLLVALLLMVLLMERVLL